MQDHEERAETDNGTVDNKDVRHFPDHSEYRLVISHEAAVRIQNELGISLEGRELVIKVYASHDPAFNRILIDLGFDVPEGRPVDARDPLTVSVNDEHPLVTPLSRVLGYVRRHPGKSTTQAFQQALNSSDKPVMIVEGHGSQSFNGPSGRFDWLVGDKESPTGVRLAEIIGGVTRDTCSAILLDVCNTESRFDVYTPTNTPPVFYVHGKAQKGRSFTGTNEPRQSTTYSKLPSVQVLSNGAKPPDRLK